jgi:hypothetical protein
VEINTLAIAVADGFLINCQTFSLTGFAEIQSLIFIYG